jgi:hypothetical protein
VPERRPTISVETLIALASMVFGLGGFLTGIFPSDKPRTTRLKIILMTCFVAFVSTASVSVWQNHQHSERVLATTEKLVAILGAGPKTIDQLYEESFPADFSTVSESLGKLIETKKVDHRVEDVKDTAGLPYRVRLYFVKQPGS